MQQDPYALEHLLPAGTLLLELDSELGLAAYYPAHGSENWGSLAHFLEPHGLELTSASKDTRSDLDFLVANDFVRATWRHAAAQLHVRVYLVPFDLPGLHGCLRHRDPAKVLNRASSTLFSLLQRVDLCEVAWRRHAANTHVAKPFIPPPSDARSLSEIFEELPSPKVDASTFLSGTSPEMRAAYKDALHWEAPSGMRLLFPYQRRTVARMLQQELDPGLAVDPLYIPVSGVCDSATFYLQPSTMELLCEPPMRTQVRGGILCEEMGTGKTCMVLALIMATKHQLSAPEEAPWDVPERPILTPLAFRHFNSPQFREARCAARVKSSQSAPFPSLVEMLTHFICTSPERLGPPEFCRHIEQQPHLWGPITRNVPFYHVYEHILDTPSRRRKPNRGPRKVYLTSATLIVVPQAIIAQWQAEINKHCDGGSLRVLELGNQDRGPAIPPVQELASKYDIVLMTHQRFAEEEKRCNPSELYSWRHCECESSQWIRVPSCTCPESKSISPLIQIRWKRLVVDEGHVCASQKSSLALLAKGLNVERKWIVSGTPTQNLMGLSLGAHESSLTDDDLSTDDDPFTEKSPSIDRALKLDQSIEAHSPEGTRMDIDDQLILPYPKKFHYPDEAVVFDGITTATLPEDTSMSLNNQSAPPPRWTAVDRNDLNLLKDMIENFLGVPEFAYESSLFRKRVIDPLMDHGGPRFGAIQVVSQVMGQVMYRHQVHIVEGELPDRLPRLKEKTVVLKFQPLAAKTYNVMQAGIAVNAVDSERKDQDYFFHPLNRKLLKQTLENLTQTMFWRTDQQLFDIDEAIYRSKEALEKALQRGCPDSDIQLLKESIQRQEEAATDILWRDVMKHEDNPFVIRGLSEPLRDAWLKLDACGYLLDPDRITKLRNVLVNSPLITEERLVEHGFDVAAQEKENAIKHEEYMRSRKRKKKQDEDVPTNLKILKENSKACSKGKLAEMSRALSVAIDQQERGLTDDTPRSQPSPSPLTQRSHFASLKIGNSLSSKVDYILRKVLKHAPKEKFLIFSAFPLSLAYLAEALQVVQVPYLQYTYGVERKARQQTVVTFETSDKYRVLLLEPKLGARGLNLVTASRIIFCEPVWQADVESQAIKRAHRIGQKNDRIKVSTLVMRGTSEEVMMTRRRALKHKLDKLPAMEQDVGMRTFMENPTFIKLEDMEPHAFDVAGLDIPLVPQPPAESVPGDAVQPEDVHIDDPRPRIGFAPLAGSEEGGPAKKQKRVHFG